MLNTHKDEKVVLWFKAISTQFTLGVYCSGCAVRISSFCSLASMTLCLFLNYCSFVIIV